MNFDRAAHGEVNRIGGLEREEVVPSVKPFPVVEASSDELVVPPRQYSTEQTLPEPVAA